MSKILEKWMIKSSEGDLGNTLYSESEVEQALDKPYGFYEEDPITWRGRGYTKVPVIVREFQKDQNSEFALGREEGYNIGYEEGVEEGKDEGFGEGHTEGYDEGISEGRFEGMEEGRDEGYALGYELGFEDGKEEGKKEGLEDCKAEIE